MPCPSRRSRATRRSASRRGRPREGRRGRRAARALPRARRGPGGRASAGRARARRATRRPAGAAAPPAPRSRRRRRSRPVRRRRGTHSRASRDACSARSAPPVRYRRSYGGGPMAGLMSRASLVVKSKISKLLDRAENPTETLDYSYEKQLELLQNVKRGVADVVTAKKRLQMQSGTLEQSVVKLEQQARQALGAGNEDL